MVDSRHARIASGEILPINFVASREMSPLRTHHYPASFIETRTTVVRAATPWLEEGEDQGSGARAQDDIFEKKWDKLRVGCTMC